MLLDSMDSESKKKLFWVDFLPCRADFHTTLSTEETASMVGHLRWLEVQQEAGRLHFAGRSSDASRGVAIFEVDDEQELMRHIAENPACRVGHLTPQVKPYRLPTIPP